MVKGCGLLVLLLIEITVYTNMYPDKQKLVIPVAGATPINFDVTSFWHDWGDSRHHKGIDIFMPLNAKVISPGDGIVVSYGHSTNGGNYIYILGPSLKTYYFAHLNKILVSNFQLVKASDVIGLVGDTGNAKDKPFHLHFSVCSLVPIFHYWNSKDEGWKKMFYLDPVNQFKAIAGK